MNIKPHFLPSTGARSVNTKVGIVHLVERANGDNFNVALCGIKPKGKSLGWIESSSRNDVNCEKCLRANAQEEIK